MKKIKSFLISFCLILLLPACSNDENNAPTLPLSNLPTKIKPSDYRGSYHSFVYNDQSLITTVTHWMGTATAKFFIVYDKQNRVSQFYINPPKKNMEDKLKLTIVASITFDYKTQNQIEYEQKQGEQNTSTKGIIKINDKQQITEIDNENLNEKFEYDNKNRISRVTTVRKANNSITHTTTYSYDDKNGLYKNVNTPQWLLVSFLYLTPNFVNNVTEIKSTEDFRSRKITYKYNQHNYPTSFSGDINYGSEPVNNVTHNIQY